MPVGWAMRVEDPDIKVGSFEGASPYTISSDIKSGSWLCVGTRS